jgi:hypothetical protein
MQWGEEIIKSTAKDSLDLYELIQNKPWFDKGLLLLDKIQWLQDPNKSNVNNLNTVRREASRHFRNKKKKYLKAKSDELETNSKIKNTKTCIGTAMTLRRFTSLELICNR